MATACFLLALLNPVDDAPSGIDLGLLGRLTDRERQTYVNKFTKQRHHLQEKLRQHLRAETDENTRFTLIYLMGIYRMPECAEELASLIRLEASDDVTNTRLPLWGQFPVVEALSRIGAPAIPKMIHNIETSEDEKGRELSAMVIRNVQDAEVGRFVIERAIKKQADPIKKKRLEESLKYVDAAKK